MKLDEKETKAARALPKTSKKYKKHIKSMLGRKQGTLVAEKFWGVSSREYTFECRCTVCGHKKLLRRSQITTKRPRFVKTFGRCANCKLIGNKQKSKQRTQQQIIKHDEGEKMNKDNKKIKMVTYNNSFIKTVALDDKQPLTLYFFIDKDLKSAVGHYDRDFNLTVYFSMLGFNTSNIDKIYKASECIKSIPHLVKNVEDSVKLKSMLQEAEAENKILKEKLAEYEQSAQEKTSKAIDKFITGLKELDIYIGTLFDDNKMEYKNSTLTCTISSKYSGFKEPITNAKSSIEEVFHTVFTKNNKLIILFEDH